MYPNFVNCDDPQRLWIGGIIQSGEQNYSDWKRRTQSLSYVFKNETEDLFLESDMKQVFSCKNGHPLILKKISKGKHFYRDSGNL